jgi:transcriptional regulator with XRE-family HTH domain
MSAIGNITAPLIGDDPSGLKELGRQLEEARCKAGMSQAELGILLGFSQSTISRVLDGKYPHMSPQMRRTAEWVIAMAHGGHSMATAPYLTLEQSATCLRDWEPSVIPGLLQTEGYARCALAASDPWLKPAELDQAVALRMRRQEVWTRADPPIFAAIISEAALRRRVGSAQVMRDQMARLIEMNAPPARTIQVLSFDADDSVGLLAPFVLASLADQPDAAFLDDTLNGRTTGDHGKVAKLREHFDALRTEAENRAGSIRMIREAEARWTRQMQDGGNPHSAATAIA